MKLNRTGKKKLTFGSWAFFCDTAINLTEKSTRKPPSSCACEREECGESLVTRCGVKEERKKNSPKAKETNRRRSLLKNNH